MVGPPSPFETPASRAPQGEGGSWNGGGSGFGAARARAIVLDDDLADLRQRRGLRPPVAGDASARLVLAADLVGLVAAERQHAPLVLAEIEEDVAGARRRRGAPHRRDGAERGAGELHEIAVALEAARHGAARAAHARRLEAGIDEDRAPGIAPLAALRQCDELLDAAIARTLVETEIGFRLGQPRRWLHPPRAATR